MVSKYFNKCKYENTFIMPTKLCQIQIMKQLHDTEKERYLFKKKSSPDLKPLDSENLDPHFYRDLHIFRFIVIWNHVRNSFCNAVSSSASNANQKQEIKKDIQRGKVMNKVNQTSRLSYLI